MKNRVREIRKSCGLTAEGLARKTEIASADISKIERGLTFVYPGWRKRIALALDVQEIELFPRVGENHD